MTGFDDISVTTAWTALPSKKVQYCTLLNATPGPVFVRSKSEPLKVSTIPMGIAFNNIDVDNDTANLEVRAAAPAAGLQFIVQ